MQKTYCDVCKQEIKHQGTDIQNTEGKVLFHVTATLNPPVKTGSDDLCLACTVKAIHGFSANKLKRVYTKPAPKEAKGSVNPASPVT